MSRLVVPLLSLALASSSLARKPPTWTPLQPGVDMTVITVDANAPVGDRKLTAVRIDPARAPLRAVLATENGGAMRTAAEWCQREKLAVAINLGMFKDDQKTNVGYLRNGAHHNNSKWSSRYQSAIAFAPGKPAEMVDLDENGARARIESVATVVQNLRLVKYPGHNTWRRRDKRWSEAAVAADKDGHILFVFARSPFSMPDFDRALVEELGVVRAMHVEGGPEASLSIHTGKVELDLFGSYETGFMEHDNNDVQWPIPNVLAVSRSTLAP